jgi:hypothetical protein
MANKCKKCKQRADCNAAINRGACPDLHKAKPICGGIAMDNRQAQKWYMKWPADSYAIGPVEFPAPVGVADVRRRAIELDGGTLPAEWECWPADQ